MKSLLSLLTAALFVSTGLVARAQPAPKIFVVDMVKLYDGHYKTAEYNATWTKEQEEATAQLQALQKQINDMKDQYVALDAQTKNTMLKDEVRAKAQADGQKLLADLQAKNDEGVKYRDNFTTSINQRIKNFRDILFEEIGKVAADVVKKKGGNFAIDKSAVSSTGIPAIIFVDPAYDITDEVMDQINKDRPPASPAASTPAPAGAKK